MSQSQGLRNLVHERREERNIRNLVNSTTAVTKAIIDNANELLSNIYQNQQQQMGRNDRGGLNNNQQPNAGSSNNGETRPNQPRS